MVPGTMASSCRATSMAPVLTDVQGASESVEASMNFFEMFLEVLFLPDFRCLTPSWIVAFFERFFHSIT